jgi:peptidoglycan hydrolase-like protein with peptidoglycan-binding domain
VSAPALAAEATEPQTSVSPKPGWTRRRKALASAAVAAALIGGATCVVQPWHHSADSTQSGNTESGSGHSTAPVVKGSLSAGTQVAGSLVHDAATDITSQGHGILTALPKPGDLVKAGQQLYEVDGAPVILMTGDRPLWRDLAAGIPDGKDVAELKQNLIGLGFSGAGADQKFTADTTAAVKRWQQAVGLDPTGTVKLGSVVMLPFGTARVQRVAAQPGAAVGGAVGTVTSTDLVVDVQPTKDQISLFTPGGKVSVELGDGTQVPGAIRSVVQGTSDTPSGGQDQSTSVVIALDDQSKVATAGTAPVTVTVVSQTVNDALIVPVTALLALAGGGYAVQVGDGGGKDRLVKVDLGLVADARAEIKGDVQPGDQVVIPQ